MPLVLDTSVVVAAERRRLDIARYTAGRNDAVYLSVITASELLHGVHRANTPARRAVRGAFIERLLATIPVLEIDLGTARVHARIWADLAAQGIVIGAHDLWIAAAAITSDSVLATADAGDFRRVPGLQVELWDGDSGAEKDR